ncbi:MAG: outer membrane lipoprotein-sorting protein [Nannocystis sp.]|nr:outer membrane lipoprotein-sorting protein [Nannocystis sp.]
MKSVSLFLATLLLTPALGLAGAPTAAAAEDASAKGAAILKVADQRASTFPNQSYVASMDVLKDGKKTKTLVFNMVMKDLEKQFITFTAPGDVAGMKILMEDANTLWIYSPEFKKVRRVASHMQNQGFMGSEFTPEDMKLAKLAGSFDATLLGKTGDETTLQLTPKSAEVSSYTKLEIVIDSKVGGITKIRYYDGSGAAVREQVRGGWVKHKGAQLPTEISMKNLKTGDETIIHLSEIDVETPISDDLFSRRMLMRG